MATIPALTAKERISAIRLDLKPIPSISGFDNAPGWDNWANYSVNQQASAGQKFVVSLKQGATYTFASSSWYDPYELRVFDAGGNILAVDTGDGAYGSDYIFDVKAGYSGDYYIDPSWNQSVSASLKYALVSVYEDVDTIPKPVVTEYGTAGVDAYAISGKKSASTIKLDGQTVTITKTGQADRKYVNVERFAFDDGWVATDISGNAGQAYRLYKAAFDRTPDTKGLGFWIKQLDGGASLQAVAQEFVGSTEFASLYGSQISQKDFVAAVYKNVLHRELDQAGADFWLTAMTNGASRAQVLTGFSESTENQQAVIGAIQKGIQYDYWW